MSVLKLFSKAFDQQTVSKSTALRIYWIFFQLRYLINLKIMQMAGDKIVAYYAVHTKLAKTWKNYKLLINIRFWNMFWNHLILLDRRSAIEDQSIMRCIIRRAIYVTYRSLRRIEVLPRFVRLIWRFERLFIIVCALNCTIYWLLFWSVQILSKRTATASHSKF